MEREVNRGQKQTQREKENSTQKQLNRYFTIAMKPATEFNDVIFNLVFHYSR